MDHPGYRGGPFFNLSEDYCSESFKFVVTLANITLGLTELIFQIAVPNDLFGPEGAMGGEMYLALVKATCGPDAHNLLKEFCYFGLGGVSGWQSNQTDYVSQTQAKVVVAAVSTGGGCSI